MHYSQQYYYIHFFCSFLLFLPLLSSTLKHLYILSLFLLLFFLSFLCTVHHDASMAWRVHGEYFCNCKAGMCMQWCLETTFFFLF
ncbi:hypothetical protein DFH27DRAFT_16347 [Peziza echinospora]|nr:hypothetical protein DFH27DRAFT_16347 [Peziza echinospora]